MIAVRKTWHRSRNLFCWRGKVSATLHQARTICRRAERDCIRLSREEDVSAELNKYLNRLSDALFVMARWVAKTKAAGVLWQRESDAPIK